MLFGNRDLEQDYLIGLYINESEIKPRVLFVFRDGPEFCPAFFQVLHCVIVDKRMAAFRLKGGFTSMATSCRIF